jgi:hypothetical protein
LLLHHGLLMLLLDLVLMVVMMMVMQGRLLLLLDIELRVGRKILHALCRVVLRGQLGMRVHVRMRVCKWRAMHVLKVLRMLLGELWVDVRELMRKLMLVLVRMVLVLVLWH